MSTTTDLRHRDTLADYADIASSIELRRLTTATETIPTDEGGAILRATATAVIRNPWLGTDAQHDLGPESERVAPLLAKLLTDRLLDALGGADAIQTFGKAALVGTGGEQEHAGALIHTPYFGNLVREALDGTSILCFVDGRTEAGELLRVPMWHKTAAATRSHYQSIDVALGDAPRPSEIVVIAAASTGPRPHARIGDRTTDTPVTSQVLKEIEL